MTKRERAIRAARNEAEKRGWLFDTPVHAADLGAIIDAAMAIMAEPDEPPEGKLRVGESPLLFVSFASAGGGFHFRVVRFSGPLATGEDFEELIGVLKKDVGANVVLISWRRAEANVTPWQPLAEEMVQGREVDG